MDIAHWTCVLDGQLASGVEEAIPGKADAFAAGNSRATVAAGSRHSQCAFDDPSESSTCAITGDDGVSVISADDFPSRRRPRIRPGRRAKRRQREHDFNELTAVIARSAEDELVFETGGLPLSAFSALAFSFESVDEELDGRDWFEISS